MSKPLLYISILITFTVIMLIVSNVYHNATTSTISQDTTIQIIPITPTFDTKAIERLRGRKKINVDLQKSINTTPIPTIASKKTSSIPSNLETVGKEESSSSAKELSP